MSYAVRNDGKGWRAVASRDDVSADETFSETAPVLKPAVPALVEMRQVRLALHEAGLLPKVNAAITALTGNAGEVARIEWEFSQVVRREQSLVMSIGAALKLSEAEMDAIFINAAKL